MESVEHLIKTYELMPHPEGGYFRETYRSAEVIRKDGLPSRFGGDRSLSTAIYYLLPAGAQSRLHRILADELWHFYLGGPLTVVELLPDGRTQETILGSGHKLQHLVPAGHWFGAYPLTDSKYSLVGCTVSPGFDFADFELGDRARLLEQYPEARAKIERLT